MPTIAVLEAHARRRPQHDAPSLPFAPMRSAQDWGASDSCSLTWSNTWLLVALYFCAMASATAFGPMNSVFQLWELRQKRDVRVWLSDGNIFLGTQPLRSELFSLPF